MHNVLLVNTFKDLPGVNVIALCILSSVLKQKGHKVRLLDCSSSLYQNVREIVESFCPDLVGINVMTSHQLKVYKEVSSLIKKLRNVPIIAGGMAVSLDPETYISLPTIDAICIGEGEQPLLDILDNIDNIQKWATIPNLWIKLKSTTNGQNIVKNPVRPLIENLDALPLIDLSLFHDSLSTYHQPYIALMANRGCPYSCTYCANHNYRNLFPNKDKYVRYRNPTLVVREMIGAKERYPSCFIYFEDDTFALNKDWLIHFIDALSKAVFYHPFSVNIRLEKVDIDILERLTWFGLRTVRFGVETGDEQYRSEVLQRNVSNEDYVRNAKIIHRLGLKLVSYNMLGLPFGSESMIRKTIKMNSRFHTDESVYQTFKPYKGIALRELVERERMLTLEPEVCDDKESSYRKLFISTKCSQRMYNNYFCSLRIVGDLMKNSRWLRNQQNLVYYLTIFLKAIVSMIPSKTIRHLRRLYEHFFKSNMYPNESK